MKIQDLLSSSDRWTRGANARLKDGCAVESGYEDAVCWCLVGAAVRCYPDGYESIVDRVVIALGIGEQSGDPAVWLTRWNDSKERTFADIRNLVESLNI